MNRIIKFRAKRTDNGEWVTGSCFTTPLTADYDILPENGAFFDSGLTFRRRVIADENGCVFEIIPDTVGQLVKVLNGKEFYEGDIARTKDEAELIVILTWIDKHSMYGWLTVEEYNAYKDVGYIDLDRVIFWTYAFDDETVKGIEVIGNIHDNPELLTAK
jgi:uncharacterized phage protein (TIGR01671 family)